MPSTTKSIEAEAFEAVRSTPFTKIHGRPSRNDYETLKKEASDLASELEDITYDWTRSPTGEEYGLLAEIIGEDEYQHLTNLTWVQETEPGPYDPAIDDTTPTHARKRMEQEWERTRQTWAIRKGFLRGVAANMREALDENWYSQLKHLHTAYRNVQPIQILNHLNTRWCPLDVHAKKLLKAEYWTEWDGVMHLTAFEKRLDDEQIRIERFGITISDEDKLQFYLEQMYECNHFDQTQMTTWENKPEATKNDWAMAKQYFEGLIRDFEVYEQNSGGTTGKSKYESANHAADADKGDELRRYIATIAAAAVAKEEKTDELAASIRDTAQKKTDDMTAQLKSLHDAVAKLTLALANKENEGGNGGGGGGGGNRGGKPYGKSRCMGAYCWSHGWHPVGEKHNSTTCIYKKEGHKTDATFDNIMGGNQNWPSRDRVIPSQQTHATFAGKSKPSA